ncbi:MAG: glycosyltransferase, partial [Solirubrobacteraceae bacterium]
MSLISVITPAYNREQTIEATLDSLLAQSLSDWETIVVDDGSTDRTAEIAEGYARRDRRIRLHRQPNAGVGAARNAALALAASPWALFLDADDWISPDALELLSTAAAAQPDAMLVHGGCIRLLPSGAEVAEADLPPPEEMFEAFARTCVFSIHTCLVRTDLVRAVGGFDESLTTSEDWDLWQRIVRTGHTPIHIPQNIAYYRVRLGSASRNPREALRDGIVVVDRCHGPDPRLQDWPGELHPAVSADCASSARIGLAAYAAGLQLAGGSDARELLELVTDGQPGDIDGEGLAGILFEAIALGRGEPQAAWSTFPAEIHAHLHEFVQAMAEKVDDNWLEYAATAALERLMVQQAPDDTSRIGQTQLRRIQIGKLPADIALEPGVARVVLELLDREKAIGMVVLPSFDEVLPGRVAADAVLTNDHCWSVLRRVTERIRPDLAVTRSGGRLIVRRADT